MRGFRKTAWVAAALILLAAPAFAQQRGQVWYAWAPKPAPLTPWKAPNKPVWRLPEILAAHRNASRWTQPILHDPEYDGNYVQMAPGDKTRTQFYADDRAVFVVQSGQIRFDIAGQQPFVATKGFLVDVPYRVAYSLESVGAEPALYFAVTRSGRTPVYPAEKTDTVPPTAKGKLYIKTSYRTPPDTYTDVNQPSLDFLKDYVGIAPEGPSKERAFVSDTMNMVDIIRGRGVPTPPESNKGHFHVDYSEFWFILEGQIDYLMEGQKFFTANQGDIAYAPQGRWHRASFGGTGMDTRLAFNPRPHGMHNFCEDCAGRQ